MKLKLLGGLASTDVVDPALLGRVQLTLPEALLVAEKRNRFIHDQWLFVGSEGRTVNMVPTNFHITELYAFLETVGKQQTIFHTLLRVASDLQLTHDGD